MPGQDGQDKLLNEWNISQHSPRSRKGSVAGGDMKIKISAIVGAVVITSIVIISAFAANTLLVGSSPSNNSISSSTNTTINSNVPFATLVGTLSNPHPYYNSSYGYISPNLWDFTRGGGNVTMSFYSNSSLHTIVHLLNMGSGISIFAYPSIHFTYNLPMSLQSVYADNLSSFISFDVKKISPGMGNDIAYDMFLGQNGTLQYEVEIMLLDNLAGRSYNGTATSLVTSTNIPIEINGELKDVSWGLYSGNSASGTFPSYVFIPSIVTNNSTSYKVSFSPFLSFLQNNSKIPSSVSIVRLGIGSEFSGSAPSHPFTTLNYSFWMQSYFMLNGTKYQVVQPSEAT